MYSPVEHTIQIVYKKTLLNCFILLLNFTVFSWQTTRFKDSVIFFSGYCEAISITFIGYKFGWLVTHGAELVTNRRGPHPHDEVVSLSTGDWHCSVMMAGSMKNSTSYYMLIDVVLPRGSWVLFVCGVCGVCVCTVLIWLYVVLSFYYTHA